MRFGFQQPFTEQQAFFRRKLSLPTARWDDIERSAHDRAFMVAGALKSDLLADLKSAVDKAISEGRGIGDFRRDFERLVAHHGWTGWTGEGTAAGRAWRTRVIYQTNLSTSYAAGRWAQLHDPGLVALRPYLKYHHADGVLHPRPHHLAWDGLVLPRDHPFWKTHATPNGWGCHCWISAASETEYQAAKLIGKTEPPAGWDAIDPKTGTPVGIDKGFDYAPGASVDLTLRQMVADKLITYPPAITKALSFDMNRYVAANFRPSSFAAEVLADRSLEHVAWLGFPDNFEQIEAATGLDVRGFMGVLPADMPRHAERSHQFDGGDQRPIRPADYDRAWLVLTEAERLQSGHSSHGLDTIVAYKEIDGETYRAVFEVRPGRKNRTLALTSLVVKIR